MSWSLSRVGVCLPRVSFCMQPSHITLPIFFSPVLPSFTKIPYDIAIRTGTTARLECAATGHPHPQIAWQKDGGTDFPAARERRMHVMPDDDVFFITDVKIDDMGVYSCTAQNSAGSISANATLTVLGSLLIVYVVGWDGGKTRVLEASAFWNKCGILFVPSLKFGAAFQ